LIGDFPDDFDGDAGGCPDTIMIIGAVGEELLDEGKDGPRRLQHRSAGVAILHIGGMRFEQQAAAVGIDKGVALASRGGNFTLRALRTVRETLASYGSHQANATLISSRQCTKRPAFLRAILSRNCPA
jgi:hypothetical protein